jgi:hypothetical protein
MIARRVVAMNSQLDRRSARFAFCIATPLLLTLAQLSQLRTFSGFFALIFIVKPSVFSVAL